MHNLVISVRGTPVHGGGDGDCVDGAVSAGAAAATAAAMTAVATTTAATAAAVNQDFLLCR